MEICSIFLLPVLVVNGDTKGNDSLPLPVIIKVN
jgi:hypothetical protein